MDVISMRDFTRDQIIEVLDLAGDIKAAIHGDLDFKLKHGRRLRKLFKGKVLETLFLENSTRTRHSFQTAMMKGGGDCDGFPSDTYTSLKKGESWAHTAAMFAAYGTDGIAMRSTTEGLPRWTVEYLKKQHDHIKERHQQLGLGYRYLRPVIFNGGDGKNQHPTQCFLDLFTMREFARAHKKDLDGLDVAMLNDLKYGRTNASLMSVAHLFNWKLHLAYPKRFGPQAHRLDELLRQGVDVHDHGEKFEEAMTSSFFAYHSRPQKERVGQGEDLISIKELGRITLVMYNRMGTKGPYLMHPKPVDSETFEEISADLDFHPKNITDVQAENGVYVRMALLALGFGVLPSRHPSEEYPHTGLRLNQEIKSYDSDKKTPGLRSGFIEKDGIVIDHIPAGRARRLEGMLGLENAQLPVVTSSFMGGGRMEQKDLLKIHAKYELTTEQYERVKLIAPDATISYIQDGRVVRKVKIELGNVVQGKIRCGNNACVYNVPKEHAPARHHIEHLDGKAIFTCNWCEVPDTVDNIYAENRFIYLK